MLTKRNAASGNEIAPSQAHDGCVVEGFHVVQRGVVGEYEELKMD